MPGMASAKNRPKLLGLASTYPRWAGDHEPGFVHELSSRLTDRFEVRVLTPHHQGAATQEQRDGVDVYRYRSAPEKLETLVYDEGMVTNWRQPSLKFSLLALPYAALGSAGPNWSISSRFWIYLAVGVYPLFPSRSLYWVLISTKTPAGPSEQQRRYER